MVELFGAPFFTITAVLYAKSAIKGMKQIKKVQRVKSEF